MLKLGIRVICLRNPVIEKKKQKTRNPVVFFHSHLEKAERKEGRKEGMRKKEGRKERKGERKKGHPNTGPLSQSAARPIFSVIPFVLYTNVCKHVYNTHVCLCMPGNFLEGHSRKCCCL